MSGNHIQFIFACVTLLAANSTSHGLEFAGGTGTPGDPYQITTAEQLIGMGDANDLYDKHFVLVADIDLDPTLPGRKVFEGAVIPLTRWGQSSGKGGVHYGKIPMPLSGSFDGDGHTIRNCMIYNENTWSYPGLFVSIGEQGQVADLRLEDVLVVDTAEPAGYQPPKAYCGALASDNAGIVINCSVTGTIIAGSTSLCVGGGLVGHNNGLILNSSASCRASGFQVGILVGTNDISGCVLSCSANGVVYNLASRNFTSGPAGGLIGQNLGAIIRCRASCNVSGADPGGLVGVNEASGRIISCSAGGVVYGGAVYNGMVYGSRAGGLAGSNVGLVRCCFADGVVSANEAGGLVGSNSGMVRESYSLSNAVSSYRAGGLAVDNMNTGTIVNCYSLGPVSGRYVGGLVVSNEGFVQSSYATTAVPRELGRVEYVYYLDPNKPPAEINSPAVLHGVLLSPREMERRESFVGFDLQNDPNDGPAGHWFMPETGYPVLTWQTEVTHLVGVPDVSGLDPEYARAALQAIGLEPDDTSYDHSRSQEPCGEERCQPKIAAGDVICADSGPYLPPGARVGLVVSLGTYDFSMNPGNGSVVKPYEIATVGQFGRLCDDYSLWSKHFVLTSDLDLTGREQGTFSARSFRGTFNGNAHAIRGLQFDPPQSNSQSAPCLFSTIEPEGVVQDLTIEQARGNGGLLATVNKGRISDCTVSGDVTLGHYGRVAGLLVGSNEGRIERCRVRGRVRAWTNNDVGGLAGVNTGFISGSCADSVDVLGPMYVGGLVGVSYGSTARIETSYARGHVRGDSGVGGLVGRNGLPMQIRRRRSLLTAGEPVAVQDCYAACSVTGNTDLGGLIGLQDPNSVEERCFFLTLGDGGGPDNGLGLVLTDAQMRQRASFTGWDFDTIWTVCEGQDYPRLRWEDVDCGQP